MAVHNYRPNQIAGRETERLLPEGVARHLEEPNLTPTRIESPLRDDAAEGNPTREIDDVSSTAASNSRSHNGEIIVNEPVIWKQLQPPKMSEAQMDSWVWVNQAYRLTSTGKNSGEVNVLPQGITASSELMWCPQMDCCQRQADWAFSRGVADHRCPRQPETENPIVGK